MVLDGLDKVRADFDDFSFAGKKALPRFLDLISDSAIKLLRQNTPVDSGDLAQDWKVLARDSISVTIGVSDENDDKLRIVLLGSQPHEIEAKKGSALTTPYGLFRKIHHPGTQPNNFFEAVEFEMNRLMSDKMGDALAQSHRFFAPYSNKANLSKITGLTGVKFSPRRAFGKHSLLRPRTGLLSNRVRIGRRRRTGSSILSKTKRVEVG